MMHKSLALGVGFAIISLVIASFAFAQIALLERTANLTSAALDAKNALVDANGIIAEMEEAGFNTTRAKDTLQTALALYEGQLSLEDSGKKADYSEILRKAQEIQDLRNRAFEIQDSLSALKQSIEDRKATIDAAAPRQFYDEAAFEFKSERYENAEAKIDDAYKAMEELERAKSRTGVLLEASKSIGQRLIEAWKVLLIAISIISLLVFFGYGYLYRKLVDVKIKMLELEKKTLESLTQKTQEDYFNRGKLPETAYHIKIKKYGELIRDINRRLPLLREAKESQRSLFERKKARKK